MSADSPSDAMCIPGRLTPYVRVMIREFLQFQEAQSRRLCGDHPAAREAAVHLAAAHELAQIAGLESRAA